MQARDANTHSLSLEERREDSTQGLTGDTASETWCL